MSITSILVLIALILAGGVWFVLPFIPALRELRRGDRVDPLYVPDRAERDLRYFAFRFRAVVTDLLSEAPAGGYPALSDGSVILATPGERQASELRGDDGRMIVVHATGSVPPGVEHRAEIYAEHDFEAGVGATLRALLCEGDVTLRRDARVVRWVHADGLLNAESGVQLFGRATSERGITMGNGCRFERLLAPEIRYGEAIPNPAPPAIPTNPSNLKEKGIVEGGRCRVHGDLELERGSLVTCDLVVRGDLHIGSGSLIAGSIKTHGDVFIADNCFVDGSVIARGEVDVGHCCRITGTVVSEKSLCIRHGSMIGDPDEPTTLSGREVLIENGVLSHGAVHAQSGRVVAQATKSAGEKEGGWSATPEPRFSLLRRLGRRPASSPAPARMGVSGFDSFRGLMPVAALLALAWACSSGDAVVGAEPPVTNSPPEATGELAPDLELSSYQRPDGSITVLQGGGIVEPYFAVKALLAARQAGLDIQSTALPFIDWMIERQLDDGRFRKYCAEPGAAQWEDCGRVDADDAVLGLWPELLHAARPPEQWPPAWRSSATEARSALAQLRTVEGVYQIAPEIDAALLMDNAEIFGAFSRLSTMAESRGDLAGARRLRSDAEELRRHIIEAFWEPGSGMFRVSTQQGAEQPGSFYPEAVAQVYPWAEQMETPLGGPTPAFNAWLDRHGSQWLAVHADTYPWGLMARAALTLGRADVANCWMVKAAPFRHGARWNVLEEAVAQGLENELPPDETLDVPPCTWLTVG